MRTLITVFCAVLLLGSCCQKENCTITGTPVKIYGFNADVLDSVKIKAYLSDVVLSHPTDSFMYAATPSGDDYYTIPYSSFVEDRDYTIEIVQANRTFTITNIGSKEESCGSCNKQRTVYEQLEYYYIDGHIRRSNEIVLRK